jgi:glycosyltransferase involved in cell wall biosynthesis
VRGTVISFVVIAYNEAGNIARAVDTISALKGLGGHEVIIVNDGSRDNTSGIAREISVKNSNVRLIDLPLNRGRGYARHAGVAAARGDLIATVDADIILPPDWLACCRAALRSHDAVGGTALPDGDVAYIYKRFRLTPRCVGQTTTVTGSNALYRRHVFDVTGFDPALSEGEDIALNHAMRKHGFSLATVPGLLVRHEEDKTLGASMRWLFVSGKGATRQLLTYREIRQPDLVTGIFAGTVAVGLIAAGLGHQLAWLAVPAGFVAAAGIQHVRTRFETPRSQLARLALAVAVDSALLSAYFAGRIVGLARLPRR